MVSSTMTSSKRNARRFTTRYEGDCGDSAGAGTGLSTKAISLGVRTSNQTCPLPAYLDLRLIRSRMGRPGFRTRQIILVTTLLDPVKYTAQALGKLYLPRWAMELTLRHLKTTLQMEHLSCKNPENIQRELRMHLLVHNLCRRLMLEAARRERVPLDRVSFARFGQHCPIWIASVTLR